MKRFKSYQLRDEALKDVGNSHISFLYIKMSRKKQKTKTKVLEPGKNRLKVFTTTSSLYTFLFFFYKETKIRFEINKIFHGRWFIGILWYLHPCGLITNSINIHVYIIKISGNVDKINTSNGFSSDISFFIQRRTSSDKRFLNFSTF